MKMTILRSEMRRANKEHTCKECNKTIKIVPKVMK